MQLVQTCGACPEQYDVLDDDGNVVGYLRLRHGHFTAQAYGGASGKVVYAANTRGDGIFEESERQVHLDAAVEAIRREVEK